MVTTAADFLQKEGLDPLSRAILSFCQMLDEYGAWTWQHHHIAGVTVIVLLVIRLTMGKRWGINWYAFAHAIASGVGSLMCLYLERMASVQLTGMPEPLRTMHCESPLSSLHRILPGITLGYSLFDIFDGLHLGIDFLLHGTSTALVMGYFCYYEAPQILAVNLTTEASTIFLTLIQVKFVSAEVIVGLIGMFALSFFIFRIVLHPYFWWLQVSSMWSMRETEVYQQCFPPSMMYFSFTLGMVFHALNAFWFYKIVAKLRRKLKGLESTYQNELEGVAVADATGKDKRASTNVDKPKKN